MLQTPVPVECHGDGSARKKALISAARLRDDDLIMLDWAWSLIWQPGFRSEENLHCPRRCASNSSLNRRGIGGTSPPAVVDAAPGPS